MIYQPPTKETLIARHKNTIVCEKRHIESILETMRGQRSFRQAYTIDDAYRELGKRNEMAYIGLRHLMSKGFSPYEAVSAANCIPSIDSSSFQGLAIHLKVAEEDAAKYRIMFAELDRTHQKMIKGAQENIKSARKSIKSLQEQSDEQPDRTDSRTTIQLAIL